MGALEKLMPYKTIAPAIVVRPFDITTEGVAWVDHVAPKPETIQAQAGPVKRVLVSTARKGTAKASHYTTAAISSQGCATQPPEGVDTLAMNYAKAEAALALSQSRKVEACLANLRKDTKIEDGRQNPR